ncbi:OsmC/Ohr family protein [Methylophaga frappieri]|uniref:OsmC/Ohr family protein n=1 Tax=Methylophaga frappieri (strain ATCC BAA-2434 / DSM 25690 / JAM7) TaxID=754477 RepID=I1YEQ4_METFJ|nr:OsmC family protein [Methylophaga frappieri]AFJ01397.1 OsmC/Ohr family protein [Methylophaga frappieri]
MKARVKWVEDVLFLGQSGTGHTVVMEGPAEAGGQGTGMRPMELLLLGMAGCTAYDVVGILKNSKQEISDCDVSVTAERADDMPKVFTKIHVHYKIRGRQVKPNFVERAIKQSTEKYCSASIMLGKTAEISHAFDIEEIN